MTKISTADARELCDSVTTRVVELERVLINNLSAQAAFPPLDGPFELVNNVQIGAVQDETHVVTTARYDVGAIVEASTAAAWHMGCDVIAVWRMRDGADRFSPAALHSFALGMGLTTVHPFARQTVHETTGKLGYEPAVLDVVFNPLRGEGSIDISPSEAADSSDGDSARA